MRRKALVFAVLAQSHIACGIVYWGPCTIFALEKRDRYLVWPSQALVDVPVLQRSAFGPLCGNFSSTCYDSQGIILQCFRDQE